MRHRTLIIIAIAVVVVFGVLASAGIAVAFRDTNTVFDGVRVGAIDVSGLAREALRERLMTAQQALDTQGFVFRYRDGDNNERSAVIYPIVFKSDGSDSRVFADIDVDATVDLVWSVGRRGGKWRQILERLRVSGYAYQVPAVVRMDEVTFRDVLHANVERDERPARNAAVVYEDGAFLVAGEEAGVVYRVDDAVVRAASQLSYLHLEPITLERAVDTPTITRGDVEPFVPLLPDLMKYGDVVVTHEDTERKTKQTWTLFRDLVAPMLTVVKQDGVATLAIEGTALGKWFRETVASDVEVKARDAKFSIEGARVVEFQSSRAGVSIDMPAMERVFVNTVHARLAALRANQPVPTSTITLAVQKVEPRIKTGDVNNLGIREILGVGTSNFRGSPANRIKNIRHGINKLNGILIKPGEEFSLLAALRPFTIEDGYVPELVIKGDKIIPEIGGGLCQIGTTAFRMVMNSGLPITKRTNHGLVVTYYNDPSNGNPGTDATIYDPAPDFRFKNDTGHYVLWTTSMDTATGKLEFTLWGTSDGRKGSYSAPVVHNWVATGPTKEIETTELPVGKRKCQSRHPGASASFTYTVELPDGTKKDTLYKSYYRPLPEICQVGVEKLSEGGEEAPAVPEASEAPPIPVSDLAG